MLLCCLTYGIFGDLEVTATAKLLAQVAATNQGWGWIGSISFDKITATLLVLMFPAGRRTFISCYSHRQWGRQIFLSDGFLGCTQQPTKCYLDDQSHLGAVAKNHSDQNSPSLLGLIQVVNHVPKKPTYRQRHTQWGPTTQVFIFMIYNFLNIYHIYNLPDRLLWMKLGTPFFIYKQRSRHIYVYIYVYYNHTHSCSYSYCCLRGVWHFKSPRRLNRQLMWQG